MKRVPLPPELTHFKPEIGLVLGTELGFFAQDCIEDAHSLAYAQIEGFPLATAPGHAGQFVYGQLHGRHLICMQGRFHLYEGYHIDQVTLPIHVMHQLGVHTLFVTNAAGGINPSYMPGDFMLIHDHINLLGTNPLIGATVDGGIRFPDMTEAYDKALRHQIREWAQHQGIPLQEGIYLATTGPSLETPAEIRAFATLGADAVGMSTVPEVIVARHLGIRVVGISCITNAAAGISSGPLTHAEITQTTDRVRHQFADLLSGALMLV